MSTVAVRLPATTRVHPIAALYRVAVLPPQSMSILLMSARWKLTFDPWYVQEWVKARLDPRHALPLHRASFSSRVSCCT